MNNDEYIIYNARLKNRATIMLYTLYRDFTDEMIDMAVDFLRKSDEKVHLHNIRKPDNE